ncbi:hypothetical protein KC19_3G203900 [Ceratodon purpureus]|uniref:Protein kinase domain-containing protein n=1 Tax=Ceratodon purpureus TaxID=3225 RepID=A0A8T0IKM5_CERPU|nr:hypothetical protein KC19_3G203900 [Ceratodon purpureus]
MNILGNKLLEFVWKDEKIPLEDCISESAAAVDLMESSQRALHIAVLILGNGAACGVDELQQKCCLFPVTSVEIHDLCALQDSPLQILEDNKIGLAVKFLVELRSRLDHFGGTCNKAPRGNGGNFLVPALPSASMVVLPVKDEVVQDSDIKEKPPLSKRIPEFQDYVVLGEEGSGGYGTVYRVRRKSDDQIFAIKCPLEKTTREHVFHEVKMLHKHGGQEYIIRFEEVVWEVFIDMEERLKKNQRPRPNLVLQYVDHDKPEVLRKEITVQELQLYGYCLFKGLAYLHKQGIVHRDVKPGNFLFSRKRGTGFLVDFNLALVASRATVASGKYKRTCSKALKDSAKGEANKQLRTESPKNVLGKRVRKEIELNPPKRHQSLNTCDNQTGYYCSIKCSQADLISRDTDRGAMSPSKAGQLSATVRTTLMPTTSGWISSTAGEERSEKSAAVNSSSKVPVACNPVDPLQRSFQTRRSSRVVTASRKPDEEPPQSALGDLASMPQTAGVLRFSQFLKNRTLTQQSSVATPTPPASQRKRVAAIQVEKSASVRPPIPPSQSITKGAGVRRHKPLAKDGPCAGTKGYRAPEVLLKSNVQTTKLDIWSAGVSLLQLIAGKAPFPSSSSEQSLRDIAKLRGVDGLLKLAGGHDCLHKLPGDFETLNYKPISVLNWCITYGKRTEMRDRIPPELCDLLEKCLQVDPDTRIDACEALSHDFFKSVEARVAHDDGITPSTRASVCIAH